MSAALFHADRERATAKRDKPRFPAAVALQVAAELCAALKPACLPGYLIVAGSLRRRKAYVGDLEIVYVSGTERRQKPDDLFAKIEVDLVDDLLDAWIRSGTIEKRQNVRGADTWGAKIKLLRHVATGLPVDLFRATVDSWFNYLVCRTGPAASNVKICVEARKRGWKWQPYTSGFLSTDGLLRRPSEPMDSERAVFEFVGLPYLEPWER